MVRFSSEAKKFKIMKINTHNIKRVVNTLKSRASQRRYCLDTLTGRCPVAQLCVDVIIRKRYIIHLLSSTYYICRSSIYLYILSIAFLTLSLVNPRRSNCHVTTRYILSAHMVPSFVESHLTELVATCSWRDYKNKLKMTTTSNFNHITNSLVKS